jgi:hypothetical protein
VLPIDLTERRIRVTELERDLTISFLGGRGFNSNRLYDEVAAGTDPLGPENRLMFSTGPLVGTAFPTACRFNVSAKSPLTGILADPWLDATQTGAVQGLPGRLSFWNTEPSCLSPSLPGRLPPGRRPPWTSICQLDAALPMTPLTAQAFTVVNTGSGPAERGGQPQPPPPEEYQGAGAPQYTY